MSAARVVGLAGHGASVFMPIGHSPRDYDLVTDFGEAASARVQVKTSSVLPQSALGRNPLHPRRQSQLEWARQATGPGSVRLPVRIGWRRAPLAHSGLRSARRKRSQPRRTQVRRVRDRPRRAPSDRASDARLSEPQAGFPSGQRGWTVNPLAQPSQVRILLPPLGPLGRGLKPCNPANPSPRADSTASPATRTSPPAAPSGCGVLSSASTPSRRC